MIRVCVVLLILLVSCGTDFSSSSFNKLPTCSVTQVLTGAKVSCPDGTTVIISNGANGADGEDGTTSPYLPIGIIEPCGHNSSAFKEVLMILQNGQVLASFSNNANGDYTRFALIPDGSYVNTDNSGCHFTISTSGHVRTCNWSGGSQSWVIP